MIRKVLSLIKNIIYKRLHSKVRYLIIDYEKKSNQVIFLCYGTRAFFRQDLLSILNDYQLLSGLMAEQACYLGIMLGRWCQSKQSSLTEKQIRKINSCSNADLQSDDSNIMFDRKGNLIYVDKNRQLVVKSTYEIAKSKELLNQFNPIVAYSIGVYVGNQIARKNGKKNILDTTKTDNVISIDIVRSMRSNEK